MLTFSLAAQISKVYDNLSMSSKILKGERKYAIYLPPGYDKSERSYPVLYLLHGSGDDQTGWVQFGEVQYITDKAILEDSVTPMIIVMPDANTGKKGYFNDIKGDWRYEDFFFEEFIPYIEKTYRIRGKKEFRAIAGLSMGGGGTFVYALHHPELFASASPLSAAARDSSPEDMVNKYVGDAGNYSKKEITQFINRYNIHYIIENTPAEKIKKVRWYIDCGDDDFLYEGNSLVHIAMRKKGIPHEYRVRDGRHSWVYWRESLPEVLKFVSAGFHR
jgi:enterochelin esterase-like enzyme